MGRGGLNSGRIQSGIRRKRYHSVYERAALALRENPHEQRARAILSATEYHYAIRVKIL